MQNTLAALQAISPLTSASEQQLIDTLEEKRLLAKEVLFSPDVKHHYVNFIERGAVRAFAPRDGKEFNFWLGMEGDLVFPYQTYLTGEVSYETVEALEECLIYRLPITQLRSFYEESLEWASWGRRFAEREMVSMEKKFISYHFLSARERYEEILTNHPELLQRMSLGNLASFLGVSQVSLSRIRAGRQ